MGDNEFFAWLMAAVWAIISIGYYCGMKEPLAKRILLSAWSGLLGLGGLMLIAFTPAAVGALLYALGFRA